MDKFITHPIKVSFKCDSEEYRLIEDLAAEMGISVDRAVELVVVVGLNSHVRENIEVVRRMKG